MSGRGISAASVVGVTFFGRRGGIEALIEELADAGLDIVAGQVTAWEHGRGCVEVHASITPRPAGFRGAGRWLPPGPKGR